MDIFQKGFEKVKGAARTLKQAKKNGSIPKDLFCNNVSSDPSLQAQEDTCFNLVKNDPNMHPLSKDFEKLLAQPINKESTFQINLEAKSTDKEYQFSKVQLNSMFSPLNIELMFIKPENSTQDIPTGKGNSINRILWGKDSISNSATSFEKDLLNQSYFDFNHSFSKKLNTANISVNEPSSVVDYSSETNAFETSSKNSLGKEFSLNNSQTNLSQPSFKSQKNSNLSPQNLANTLNHSAAHNKASDDISNELYSASKEDRKQSFSNSGHLILSQSEKASFIEPDNNFQSSVKNISLENLELKTSSSIQCGSNNTKKTDASLNLDFYDIMSINIKADEIYRSLYFKKKNNMSIENMFEEKNDVSIESIFEKKNDMDEYYYSNADFRGSSILSSPSLILSPYKNTQSQTSSQSSKFSLNNKLGNVSSFTLEDQKKYENREFLLKIKSINHNNESNSIKNQSVTDSIVNFKNFNHTSKQKVNKNNNLLLISPDDLIQDLPTKIGSMVYNKELNQWIDINESINITDDFELNQHKNNNENVFNELFPERKSYNKGNTINISHKNTLNREKAIEKKSFYNNNNNSLNNIVSNDIIEPDAIVNRSNSYNSKKKPSNKNFNTFYKLNHYDKNSENSVPNYKFKIEPLKQRPCDSLKEFSTKAKTQRVKPAFKNLTSQEESVSCLNINSSFLEDSSSKIFVDSVDYFSSDKLSEINSHPNYNLDEAESNQGDMSISYIDLLNHYNIHSTSLDLSGIGLSNLGKMLKKFTDLEHLNISNNRISTISTLPKTIVTLKAKNNWFAFDNCKTLLCNVLPHLEYIDLSGNQITDISIFSGLLHLRTLIVSRNQIKSLKGLTQSRRIKHLDFSENLLTKFDLNQKQLPYLEELDLSKNRLTCMDNIDCLTNLRKLNLQNNDICDWEFKRPMEKLETLDVSKNPRFLKFKKNMFSESLLIGFFPTIKSLKLDDCYIDNFGMPCLLQDSSLSHNYPLINKTFRLNRSNIHDSQSIRSSYSVNKYQTSNDALVSDFPINGGFLLMDPGPGTLENLSILGSSKTRFKKISINFNQLINLKTLQISNRKVGFSDIYHVCKPLHFSSLCNIPKLSSLTELILINSGISELPSNIGAALPSLEVLNLSLNPLLHTLPDSIKKMVNLKVLRCQFTALGCSCSNSQQESLFREFHNCHQTGLFNNQNYIQKAFENNSFNSKINSSIKSPNTAVSGNTNNSILWARRLANQIQNLKHLEEIDLRGCPLIKYAYTPFDEEADFILPTLKLGGIAGDKKYSENILHAKDYNINIEQIRISDDIPDYVREKFLHQVESLGICDYQKLYLKCSPESLENTDQIDFQELYNNEDEYTYDNSNKSFNSKILNALDANNLLNTNLYKYTSEMSLKEIEELAKTDIAFLTYISKICIGHNIILWRIHYRKAITEKLPSLKWLDGIECTD
ncbi:hypothetical protein BB561_000136 [Smittium simulii]|uniref:L domain-like protein n=1 Tax=Smittium simulii TaxID=133385 RepID=A0A2T9Z0A0_9FUNG|nr:hypothetical protein BB561_000136 [Smittium simulii]